MKYKLFMQYAINRIVLFVVANSAQFVFGIRKPTYQKKNIYFCLFQKQGFQSEVLPDHFIKQFFGKILN